MDGEKKILLLFLNKEIEEREKNQGKVGASPWLLMASSATLVWLMFDIIGRDNNFSIDQVARWLIVAGFLRNIYLFGKNIITPVSLIREGRFLYSNQIYKHHFITFFLDTVRLVLLWFSLYLTSKSGWDFITINLYTYVVIGLILSLLGITMLNKLIFPIYSKPKYGLHGKLAGGIISIYMLVVLAKFSINNIRQFGWPNAVELKLIMIVFALYYIWETFALLHQKHPTVEALKSYRRDLVLGFNNEITIKYQIETEILGFQLDELLRVELGEEFKLRIEIDQLLNLLNEKHSIYLNLVRASNSNFRSGTPNESKLLHEIGVVRMQCKSFIETIDFSILKLERHIQYLGSRIDHFVFQDTTLKASGVQILSTSNEKIVRLKSRLQTIIQESRNSPILDPKAAEYLF